MSLRKKKPGTRWVTGIARAQLQRIIKLTTSLLAQDAKLLAPLSPFNDQERLAFTNCKTAAEDLRDAIS